VEARRRASRYDVRMGMCGEPKVRSTALVLVVLVAAVASGCGDDTTGPPPLAPLAGGGVEGAALAGSIDVHVIASYDDAPIAGATVTVADPSGAILASGASDATGHVRLDAPAIETRASVTVASAGFVASTWYGVEGDHVTVPLVAPDRDEPSTRVSGTISGWSSLPSIAAGHYLLAVVEGSHADAVGVGPRAPIDLRTALPSSVCMTTASAPACSWSMSVRAGLQAHYAVIVDADPVGTASRDDDTFTVIGFALATGVSVDPGVEVTGEVLEVLLPADIASITVDFPPLPTGFAGVIGVPGLAAGDQGVLVFPRGAIPRSPVASVPKATGVLSGAVTWLLASAQKGDAANGAEATSIVRPITDPSATIAPPPYPLTPDVAASGTEVAIGAGSGARLHLLGIEDASGRLAWTGVVLGAPPSVMLPMAPAATLPTGSIRLIATEVTTSATVSPAAVELRAARVGVTALGRTWVTSSL